MVTEVISLVGTLANLISGFASNSSHKKTGASLSEMQKNLKIPDAINQAEALYRSDLGTGLPGYETMKSEIKSETPTTLNEAKDYLTGGGMVDALSKLYTKENQQIRALDTANEGAKIENKRRYENFLETNKSRYEYMTDQEKRELELGKIGNEQARTQDNLNFANKGAEGLDPMSLVTQLLSNPGLSQMLAGLTAGNTSGGVSLKPTTPGTAGFDEVLGGGNKNSFDINSFLNNYKGGATPELVNMLNMLIKS